MKCLKTALMVAGLSLVWSWQASGQIRTDFGVPGEALDQPVVEEPAVDVEVDPVEVDPVEVNPVEVDPVEEDYTPGGPEDQVGNKPGIALSVDAIDAVWALIDTNRDGRATDVEIFDAKRDLRRFANHPDRTPICDSILEQYDANADGVINSKEAFACLSEVRGERCPTAARAREFWLTLDNNHNGAVEPAEFHALLRPLGRVGEAMAGMLDNTLDAIDEDNDDRVVELEVYRRANAMLLIQLATEGDNIASRDPSEWISYVFAVANLDLNADNTVSPAESLAISELSQNFGKVDKNHDYALTVSELCDFKELINAAIAASFRSGNC